MKTETTHLELSTVIKYLIRYFPLVLSFIKRSISVTKANLQNKLSLTNTLKGLTNDFRVNFYC